ncbi:unknown [Clostridium sp. CAG:793]|nr:unknown [Clostridium sp. CAG:793]
MAGKVWKQLLLVILIVACLFNIVTKLVKRNSLKNELQATVDYFTNSQQSENTSDVQQ